MFDNILHQEIIKQLAADLDGGRLAPALLFSGPAASGKGSAALELARVLSCEAETPGAWNCACPGCVRHRNLVSGDLLLLGQRSFFAEISACAAAFRREPDTSAVKRLFIRSVRKLLGRFSPVLWEDDPKLGKVSGLVSDLEEDLEAFETRAETDALKTLETLVKNSMKLESGGMGEFIPIAWIRRAAYWSRLAPAGKHKCIVIENADRMQEGAKNSLLKILEEPPARVTLVLTCSRPGTLLPTIRSRLRNYRFARRSAKEEIDVIRRIFRDRDYAAPGLSPEPGLPPESPVPEGYRRDTGIIAAYLESFLPVDNASLYSLGAYFTASIAAAAVRERGAAGTTPPDALADLEKFAVPLAEKFGRPAPDIRTILFTLNKHTDNFEVPGLFARFCKNILLLLSAFLRGGESCGEKTELVCIWKRELTDAFGASDTYNIKETMVMEQLALRLKNTCAGRGAP
ncbi:MAG: DNA polymerase III [Treponema sp.]|jgi:DNA polymerase-3 subunit gamma/tau|nr:DNA polymerase III [Treponema sp.]